MGIKKDKPKRKNKKQTDKKEDKVGRLATVIANNKGKAFRPTPLAKLTNLHVSSLKDLLNELETIQDAGRLKITRDENKEILTIEILENDNEELAFKREIRDSIKNIQTRFDELSKELKTKLKK